ncbi:MAG: phosphoribosylanthranilate isomerase [Blastocatellia bacterium]
MTKVKICGITNLEDALAAVEFGADMLGFNFYLKSPRYIAPHAARWVTEQLPQGILKVGVFVNGSIEYIQKTAVESHLDAVQLHGDETPEFANELRAETDFAIIKVFRVLNEFSIVDLEKFKVDAILLDSFSQEFGGTGETFDWDIAKSINGKYQMYLAGGLNPENIDAAVRSVRPYAVDVASGVESMPGKKDPKKVEAFIKNARNA